jgi:hypothetical protein
MSHVMVYYWATIIMRNRRENKPQKVALTHNSVKNNECDVTYVLKEPRRRSKCAIHNS